jgi:23S rRNA (uracil1939-C5)-methyltransferase
MPGVCPFFGRCGGCRLDFAADDYKDRKLAMLDGIVPDEIVWIDAKRRRAEIAFLNGAAGFFAAGSNDIVPIDACPLLDDDINALIPKIALPGAGNVLITQCDNGLVVDFNSPVQFYPAGIKDMDALRITWNGRVVAQRADPLILGRVFPPNGFLQPTFESEHFLRRFVSENAAGRIADLFCGIGTLTIGMNAAGFDISDAGYGRVRNLSKNPLTPRELAKYDCIVMDPPRAGGQGQCAQIARLGPPGPPVVYISCNPAAWVRDRRMLERGASASAGMAKYKCARVIAIDQFRGSGHWEIASVFRMDGA